ncbi:MAG TPA: methionyl-tRNA formyltransferase [Candidatus Eisenbacteria bacterium]|nr:methionyl-tRNA formyltransferase [Candidatus Eisenbacteria bacterium]
MRTAYLGTSEFAATVLRRLAGSPHRPALAVTPPDSRRGRGRKLSPPPAAAAARELGLELHQTADVNSSESLEAIRAVRPGAIAFCAFGQLIREPLLSEFTMLNVHPSLIPRWRGAAPIERALMAGDRETGVTIMRVTAGLDSGPVAVAEAVAIEADDDYASLAGKLAELGGEVLVRALDTLETGQLTFTEQDDSLATYAEKLGADERHLHPGNTAAELERTVRALSPHIGAHLELDGGDWLGVRAARAVPDGPPAGAIEARGDALLLGAADGALRLDVVQPPGKKPMAAADFLRGHDPPTRAI